MLSFYLVFAVTSNSTSAERRQRTPQSNNRVTSRHRSWKYTHYTTLRSLPGIPECC